MIHKVKQYSGILIVLVLSLIALLPLFHSGFFPIHDDEQVGRLYELHLDVISGHIPPRLSQNLGYGYDYPLFSFYPSFVYYIAEVYHLFGFSYITSIKLMIATGFIFAAVAMYKLSKYYFGTLAGITSSVFYTYASYHSVDVYVRGALPEFWSFVFIPAVFYSFTRLAKEAKTAWIIGTGALLAGFVLTHNLIAMMSAPFLLCFLLYLLFTNKEKKRFIVSVLYAGGIGIGLSAYFWLPSLAEKQYTMVSLLTKELADYAIHFVYPIQFWYSPWGYGGSTAGLADGLSFQLGKIYLLCLSFVFVYALLLLKKQRKTALLLFLLLGMFVFSLFMQIPASKSIWDALKSVMAYIQFPWRFLVFTFFFASFAIGALFTTPFPLMRRKWILYGQYLFAIFVILVVFYKAVTIFAPSKYLTSVTDANYISEDVIRWKTSNLAFEYVPNGIATKKLPRGNTVVAITKEQIAKGPFSVISGKMQIQVTKNIPQEKRAEVSLTKTGILQINVYDFPGWHIYVDGNEVSYSSRNALKLLRIPLSKGSHTVDALFQETPVRMIGDIVSGITILGLIGYGFSRKIKRK